MGSMIIISMILMLFLSTSCSINEPDRNLGESHAKLYKLLSPSYGSVENCHQVSSDNEQLVNDSISRTNSAKTYTSLRKRTFYIDGQVSQITSYQMDYANSAFLVTEAVTNEKQETHFDQWVSLGYSLNFTKSGKFPISGASTVNEINYSLTANNFIEVLENNNPSSSYYCDLDNKKFLRLEYTPPIKGEFQSIYNELFTRCNGEKEHHCQILMWIDHSTHYLTKVEIAHTHKNVLNSTITQGFACYDDDIVVEAPRWITATHYVDENRYEFDINRNKYVKHYKCSDE